LLHVEASLVQPESTSSPGLHHGVSARRRRRRRSSSLLCMSGGLPSPAAAAQSSCAPPHSSCSSRAEDTQRDGREQPRDQRLRAPVVCDPSPGGEARLHRGRGVQVDPTQCRRDVFFNDETDAVSRPQIISVPTEPSGPRARLRQGTCSAS